MVVEYAHLARGHHVEANSLVSQYYALPESIATKNVGMQPAVERLFFDKVERLVDGGGRAEDSVNCNASLGVGG